MTAPDREVFLSEVREAIWTEFERQSEAERFDPYVDRDNSLIDGVVNLTPLAQAAIDAMVRHMGPGF